MSIAFDECLAGRAADPYVALRRWLDTTPLDAIRARSDQAELFFRRLGITFAVYGEQEANERVIPFDVIPRLLSRQEWTRLERGLIQRVRALNALLEDLYGAQEILKAGVIPAELVLRNPQYRLEAAGLRPPGGVYTHVAGIDLVRTGPDQFYVLEDNARTPSGVSYMLENREMMLRLFPDLFARHSVAPVDPYTEWLLSTLRSVAPQGAGPDPTVVVMTPGQYNSAYYEHSFLADRMGVELVEGDDLVVRDEAVYMRTTGGLTRVDVIYRRVDDDYLDPLVFSPDSTLGVPGLMSAYQAGTVSIANAVGCGVADDKAVYSYMPDAIRFLLGEAPILDNVETWRCRERDHLSYVLDHLPDLVVKEVNGSGGYGMLIGPKATKAEIEAFRDRLKAQPDGFIAQPTLALSTCPTLVESGVAPRHVDLRPFVLTGADQVRVAPGGLTRVALPEGSLVVNSSQGGGVKDTWVLQD